MTYEIDYSRTCQYIWRNSQGKVMVCDEYRQKGYRYCPYHVKKT